MPSRAAYTALAVARSETGCSTVLIPWVEEPVMVTPEVVGLVGIVRLKTTAVVLIGLHPPARGTSPRGAACANGGILLTATRAGWRTRGRRCRSIYRGSAIRR